MLSVLDVSNRNGAAALHDGAAEQALVIAAVGDKMKAGRDGTGTLSPAIKVSAPSPLHSAGATHIVTLVGSPPKFLMISSAQRMHMIEPTTDLDVLVHPAQS